MDAVEEVKSRLAIEDVIGEYVQLKRAGRNWRGLSPFSNEKTPSFMVSPEKQIWHDFSSGKGGDMFTFVMEAEGLDFRQTLELLARKASVDLEQYQRNNSGNAKQKERLYEALELATKFYQTQFSKNNTALSYVLKKRGFSKATALEWQLGYSPNGGNALVKFLKSRKFTDVEIKQAGLSAQRYRDSVDMFRGRIMIPLADGQGRVIGFTARLLNDEPNAPKYINTPQTVLYDKSRHVFGLHLAKEAIRKEKYAVVAEGNLDVITSHQAGIKQVVATAGTALTEQHLKALSRFTPDIRLCFDADRAGIAATERAIPIASRVGVNLSIITIPSGKDPDELIRQNPETWTKIIQEPQYAFDWLIERYKKLLDLDSAQGKREFSDIILNVVKDLKDPVEQEHFLGEIASTIGVSQEALSTKLESERDPNKKLKHVKESIIKPKKETVELVKAQDRWLALMLFEPRLRDLLLAVQPEFLPSLSAQRILEFLQAEPNFAGNPEELAVHIDKANNEIIQDRPDGTMQNLSDYVKILVLQHEALYENLDILELRYEAVRLQTRLIEQYVKNEKYELTEQLKQSNDTQTKVLLEQAKALDILLKQAKEA